MKSILLVEDEFGIADVLALALEDDGHRVSVAANGKQALDRLASGNFDLILLDVTMPVMDGAQVGLAVRAEPRLAGVPIVMMSARPEAALRERFTGYDEFLRKPFRITMLRETLNRLFNAQQQES